MGTIGALFDALYAAEYDFRFVRANRRIDSQSDYDSDDEDQYRRAVASAREALSRALKAQGWDEGAGAVAARFGATPGPNPYVKED